MNYRLLGRSGLRVSELALGTMTFGATTGWGVSATVARDLYDRYREAGGNYIDTANQYAVGESEKLIGDFISGHRDEVVLATKFSNSPPRNDANAGGNHRKNMMQSIEASLRRLRTDYVDMYIVHSWDMMTRTDELMRAFDDLIRSGKVLHIGVSNTPAWVVAKANTLAEHRGLTAYSGLQIEYSLLARTVERDLLPMAADQDMSVLAWSPLKNGILTGKYRDAATKGAELGGRLSNAGSVGSLMMLGDPLSDRATTVVDEVLAIARELDAKPSQVALAWLRYRPVHVVPIVGATSLAQLEDNLESTSLVLSTSHVDRLDAASEISKGYPHEYLESETSKSFRSAGMYDRIHH